MPARIEEELVVLSANESAGVAERSLLLI